MVLKNCVWFIISTTTSQHIHAHAPELSTKHGVEKLSSNYKHRKDGLMSSEKERLLIAGLGKVLLLIVCINKNIT